MVLKFQTYVGAGPTPKFSLFHVWKAYEVIDRQGPIGRKALCQSLDIGEGSTRTILEKMTHEGSVDNTKKGAVLTERGRKQFLGSGISAVPVHIEGMTISSHDCAVLAKGLADRVGTGYEQRDEAVRAGAVGATTLVMRDGHLQFPDGHIPDEMLLQPLFTAFTIEDNDVIIIGTAHYYREAEKGAVTAALALGSLSQPSWSGNTTSLLGPETDALDVKDLAQAIHELVGRLPVTLRSRDRYGVRYEDGECLDTNYTGPVLEEVLSNKTPVRRIAPSGVYSGYPVVVVPILRKNEVVAALGVVDITRGGMFELVSRNRRDRTP